MDWMDWMDRMNWMELWICFSKSMNINQGWIMLSNRIL